MSKIIIDGVEIPSEKLEALGWTPPETKEIEIPCGCPVLCWNGEENGIYDESFYFGESPISGGKHQTHMHNAVEHVKIDYHRKGHCIPWHGGECPFGEDFHGLLTLYFRDHEPVFIGEPEMWKESWRHNAEHEDIIAYVILPEWVMQ